MSDANIAKSWLGEQLPEIQQLREIVSQFCFPARDSITSDEWIVPHSSSGGYSSAKIWQVWFRPLQEQTGSGLWLPGATIRTDMHEKSGVSGDLDTSPSRWCLRCWPQAEPTAQRLRWIHRQLELVADFSPQILLPLRRRSPAEQENGIRAAGEVQANKDRFVLSQGRLWQMEPWASGTNDYHASPGPERLASVTQSLAVLHRVWWEQAVQQTRVDGNGSPYSSPGASPGLVNRWNQAESLLDVAPQILHESLAALTQLEFDSPSEVDSWQDLILELQTSWNLRKTELVQCLALGARHPLPLGPVLADIWSDHLFFTGPQLSAIIDYGAVRIDSVAADLSRVLSSLCGADRGQREQALASYETERTLEPHERAAIEVFDLSSQLLGPLHWLRWIFLEHRFRPHPNLRTRIHCLLHQQPF